MSTTLRNSSNYSGKSTNCSARSAGGQWARPMRTRHELSFARIPFVARTMNLPASQLSGSGSVPESAIAYQEERVMATTFKILRKLGNGEFVYIASCTDRKQAALLVKSLKQHWPGGYEIVAVVTDIETGSSDLRHALN